MKEGFVYIATSDELNAFKIGRTTNIKTRMSQHENTYKGDFIYRYVSTYDYVKLETNIHRYCKDQRIYPREELFIKDDAHDIDYYFSVLEKLHDELAIEGYEYKQCDLREHLDKFLIYLFNHGYERYSSPNLEYDVYGDYLKWGGDGVFNHSKYLSFAIQRLYDNITPLYHPLYGCIYFLSFYTGFMFIYDAFSAILYLSNFTRYTLFDITKYIQYKPLYLYLYSKYILRHRWKKMEEVVKCDGKCWDAYMRSVIGKDKDYRIGMEAYYWCSKNKIQSNKGISIRMDKEASES